MRSQIRPAIVSFLMLTVLTGVAYPLVVTAVAKVAFRDKAEGSLIRRDGVAIGSELIGQSFTDPKYFWPRPSATAPLPYSADAGAGSNLAMTNPALLDAIRQRIANLRSADPGNAKPIPVDLVTASASGLDPHISLAAAEYQLPRVARLRHLDEQEVRRLLADASAARTFGVLGEPRVNVLQLNLALDAKAQQR